MRLEIEISAQEFSHIINALDDYKEFMLDKADFTKDRPDETRVWNIRAKEIEILRDKIQDNAETLAFEDSQAKLREDEKNTTDAMIAWAKSGKSEVTEDLQQALEVYFTNCGANKGKNKENILSHRQLIYEMLVIKCIYECHQEELKRLDNIAGIVTALQK